MECTHCNKEISSESKFCGYCGEKLSGKTRKNLQITNEIIEHLEFLGYEINEVNQVDKKDSFIASHENKSNLLINITKDYGVMVQSLYKFDQDIVEKKKDSIPLSINKINSNAVICSYFFDFDSSSLNCASWFPPFYSKREFSLFLDLHESDIQKQLRSEEMAKYYK